ncbi:DivIVA domain-containing protein [Clostridium bornimense]|uniref:DivIVA domain-containing protein n=1 Tax=Clostridium bornimense TaxID=1216932 RepID=UPI001C11C579|nr:DivIVA domain-containing protein [Clostridium bornimense]MBU5314726.1 DivIVA domain-containing protein [Clostridium bornimense]
MRLTPMDITNKEFKKSLRGFDCEEVDEFLDKVVEDYEFIYKENSSLKEKIKANNDRIKHYEQIEETIQNTLLLAQNAAEQAKLVAQKEAEMILNSANESAKKIIDKANFEVIKINDDYEVIKQDFMKFRAKYNNFLQTQMDMFKGLEQDFLKNYNIATNEKDETVVETIDTKVISDDIKEKEANETKKDIFKEVAAEEVKAIPELELTANLEDVKNYFVEDDK